MNMTTRNKSLEIGKNKIPTTPIENKYVDNIFRKNWYWFHIYDLKWK
jgi:hypothetical protein